MNVQQMCMTKLFIRVENLMISMVFPQTLNCASAAFEKAASLSKEKLIEFLILFQSYFFISLL